MENDPMVKIADYDFLLADDGPAAIVIKEFLMPVEGPGGVVFPSTYAAGGTFKGGYNIDIDPSTNKKICLIDSVGSQANRIEPIFRMEKYRQLVPQIVVEAGDREVSIFEAGHRAGDALFRCCELQPEIDAAFRSVLKGNCQPIAKLAPTSLVFGVWDSRATQAKLPRIVASTIRAFDVHELTRSAVYIPPLDYSALEVFTDEEKTKAEGDNKSPLAKRGFVHNPASQAPGGVLVHGEIRRDATLQLAALRHLHVYADPDQTLTLRRYILGLSLVAFTAPPQSYLRQGCTLVRDPNASHECVVVGVDGNRKTIDLSHDAMIAFAGLAAKGFGVGADRTVQFQKELASKDVKGDEKEKKGKAAKK
jgi:CRISPR-associated protein Csb1